MAWLETGLKARLIILTVVALFLTSCSQGNSTSESEIEVPSLSESFEKWISTCESDYRTEDCINAFESTEYKNGAKDVWNSELYSARLSIHVKPENSPYCKSDPNGDLCKALSLTNNPYLDDFICGEFPAFGRSNYYCFTSIVFENISFKPVDERVSFLLSDFPFKQDFENCVNKTDDLNECYAGRYFKSSVSGYFTLGGFEAKFEEKVSIDLNPGEKLLAHVAFAVPDLDKEFGTILITASEPDLDKESRGILITSDWAKIPLCFKNSGDVAEFSKKVVLYEDARYLNSCGYGFREVPSVYNDENGKAVLERNKRYIFFNRKTE